MPFALTPAGAQVTQGLPGDWLQVRQDGVDVGDANVEVIDIVGDPEVLLATRGVGENAHVITIRAVAPPAPPTAEIAWKQQVFDQFGSLNHSNSGSGYFNPPTGIGGIGEEMFVGLVNYSSETVVWSVIWTPLNDLTEDPAPTITGLANGVARIDWPREPPGFNPFNFAEGMLIVTVTVNGTPIAVGQRLVATSFDSSYTQIAWGPEP